MAVTETPPETVAASAEPAPRTRVEPAGLALVLGSGDHKVIGRLYIGFSLVFALLVGAAGFTVGLERLDTSKLNFLSTGTAGQVVSFHQVADPLLFVAPLVLGIAFVIVPLQLGSRSIAFPRAAAASFWGWAVGGVLLTVSYLMNGGPGGGRTTGVDLWLVATAMVVLALVVGAICLATTVLTLRSPGMTLMRIPLFSWSALVAAAMWIVSMPVLLGTLILQWVDHSHAGVSYGANKDIAGHVLWAFVFPQVYLLAIMLLGYIADVLATTSGSRLAFRGVAMGAISAFGVLGFGAYLQGGTTPDITSKPFFTVLSIAAVVPVLLLLGVLGDLFRRGGFSINAGVGFAIAGLLALLLATLGGAITSISAVDAGTAARDGVTHAALFAAVIGGLGGLHWWATKILRRPAAAPGAFLAPLLLLAGTAVYTIPDLISGWAGDGQEKSLGIEAWNTVSLIGLAVAIIGVIVAVLNVLPSIRKADDVPDDPWGGQTLEWATSSPPARGNFDEQPVVTSAEPLLDQREESAS